MLLSETVENLRVNFEGLSQRFAGYVDRYAHHFKLQTCSVDLEARSYLEGLIHA